MKKQIDVTRAQFPGLAKARVVVEGVGGWRSQREDGFESPLEIQAAPWDEDDKVETTNGKTL